MMIYTTEQGNTNPQNQVTENKTEAEETEQPVKKSPIDSGTRNWIIILLIGMAFVIALTVFVALMIMIRKKRRQNA